MQERRRWPRYPGELIVYYRTITDLETAFLPTNNQATTKNISRGGIGIVLDEYISPGTILKLDLVIPHKSRMITAYCRVVWINAAEEKGKYNAGLEIEDMESEDQDEFYEFIDSMGKG